MVFAKLSFASLERHVGVPRSNDDTVQGRKRKIIRIIRINEQRYHGKEGVVSKDHLTIDHEAEVEAQVRRTCLAFEGQDC